MRPFIQNIFSAIKPLFISLTLDVLGKFKRIQKLDNDICNYGSSLVFGLIKLNRENYEDHKKAFDKNVLVAGSISEGATMARLFFQNTVFPGRVNREAEVDLEFVLSEIPIERKDWVENIPGKPGYVRMKVDSETVNAARRLGWNVNKKDERDYSRKIATKAGYLKPYRLKNQTLSRIEVRNKYHRQIIHLLLAAALSKKIDDVELEEVYCVTKSSVGSEFFIKVHGEPHLNISFDTVPLFRIKWWPSIAEKWKSRERNWPSKKKIELITKECYIIAKPSTENKDKHETTEMRYSFAHVERALIRGRSEQQDLVYLIFKVLFYKFIKPVDPDCLTSFLTKTVMLWVCEEFPPDHEIWSGSVHVTLSHLLTHLLQAFRRGKLPYFFIEEINVIETVPKQVREAVCKEIQHIITHLPRLLYNPIDKEEKAGNEILDLMKGLCTITHEIETQRISHD